MHDGDPHSGLCVSVNLGMAFTSAVSVKPITAGTQGGGGRETPGLAVSPRG